MKNTFIRYIAFGIALLASSFALNAQTYHEEGGMKTSKTVTGPEGGYYTIKLESFATGETTVTETATPVDIVLVLDVSGSMNETMYTYTARDSQGYSYSSFRNNNYYYKHTDGNYYQVSRNERDGRYYLRFQTGQNNNTRHYLHGTEVTPDNTRPNDAPNNQNSIIWTGVLYTRSNAGSKLANLQTAVGKFIDEVTKNATQDSHGEPRSVDNQISIVKFAGPGNNSIGYYTNENQFQPSGDGNHTYDYTNYNYTEVVAGLTSVLNGGDGTLKTKVNSLNAGGATAANGGMRLARNILDHISSDRESNKVVVLFTDGEPTYGNTFSNTVANGVVSNAYTIKNTNNATVFTIGVFDVETDQIRNYMTYASSNYPQAQGPDNDGNYTPGAGSNQGYYQNASGANLNDIFESIAHASAAADATANATSQVRDVISNSFILPSGDAAGITIKIADVKSDGDGWEDPETATGVGYEVTTVTSSTGEQHKQLMVTGFDYTKPDTYNDDGFTVTAGNWVGERYTSATDKYWAGKKLIIEFKVQANDEATGGDGTATNHPDSGIYVQRLDDEGNPVKDEQGNIIYDRVNKYDVPHTDLPLLIKIKKNGLRMGESATFQIFRIRPKGWNDEGTTLEEKMANVEYNAIGKPKPDTHNFDSQGGKLDENDPMDYLEGIGWDDWSKVILTNKTGDNAYVEKDLYGLDPGWVYMVVEDDWGWAYELTGTASNQTTSEYELNPFVFHNTPRTVNLEGNPIVKHAEAVTINHFKTGEGDESYEEHYKSSKTNFETR